MTLLAYVCVASVELEQRQLISQVSDRTGLEDHLRTGSRTLYCGFDPSAESLHIGNLVPLLALRRFQLFGHRPIALVGGATGLIGDPSFKNAERTLNDRELVERWVESIGQQISRFVDVTGNNGAIVVNNLEWTRDLDVISFLRDVGKHFSVNAMIAKDSVKSRLTQRESGISFTEFSYMLLQAMDYEQLARRFGCSLQIGGSDQWGNITAGMDLVRRSLGRECFALTLPLVTKSDGTKFGKTESGSVWLDARKTSPYVFFQFWLNAADADVVRFLRMFTFVGLDEISTLERSLAEDPGRREGARVLAREVTRLVHGDDAVRSAERISSVLFGGVVRDLTEGDLEQLCLDGLPTSRVNEHEPGVIAMLASSPLAASRSAARTLVQSGAIQINGISIDDCDAVLSRQSALFGRYQLVRRGKKSWHLVLHDAI